MNPAVIRRKKVVLFLLGVVLVSQAQAQDRSLMRLYGAFDADESDVRTSRAADETVKQAEQRYASALYAPLEGAVDPANYIVGPNDQFTISIGGMKPTVSVVLVSADGGLVVPGIGRVDAGGRSLEAVIDSARTLLISSFQNVKVDIALSRPREFWVHVTGSVPRPGRYLSHPVGRLEAILKDAFLLGEETPELQPTFKPALRNVTIKHRDGTEDSYDLVRYYRTGDLSSNPYLRDGDRINVSTYDRVRSSVFVSGDVPFPGAYDYRPGDTVLDLLDLGTGNLELEPERPVQLRRRQPDGSLVTESFTVSALLDGSASPPDVEPLDHVNVPLTEVSKGVAAADGWLQFPGQYPIEVGVTTLTDLIDMAGGFREEALVRGAYVERKSAFGEKIEFADPRTLQTGRYELVSDTAAVLWKMRLGDFDFLSRQFLARWMKLDRRVSVNVFEAVEAGADPIYLRNGDRLFVPRDLYSVYVVGEVARPGRIPLVEGYGSRDYVEAAGGPGPRAHETYVIRSGSGQVLPASSPVYSGDYVFVDREGGETSSVEAERLRLLEHEAVSRSRQVALQAVTAAAALITTTILVIDRLGN